MNSWRSVIVRIGLGIGALLLLASCSEKNYPFINEVSKWHDRVVVSGGAFDGYVIERKNEKDRVLLFISLGEFVECENGGGKLVLERMISVLSIGLDNGDYKFISMDDMDAERIDKATVNKARNKLGDMVDRLPMLFTSPDCGGAVVLK